MSDILVKRVDSAHMKRMFDMALENSDVNFLSSTTNVSLEQVKNLKLEADLKESARAKTTQQFRPPQPPKQSLRTEFSLVDSIDFLLDGEDAESWLVASSTDAVSSKNKLETLPYGRKDSLGSPIESCVSSEIITSSLTPASILDTKQTSAKQVFSSGYSVSGKASDGNLFSRPRSACAHRDRQTHQTGTEEQDIRHRSRSVGSVNHTPAPVVTKKKPPKAISNITRPKSSLERAKPSEDVFNGEERQDQSKSKSRIPRIGMRSKRLETSTSPDAAPSDNGKSITRSLSSLAAKCRPFSKSVGAGKHSKLPPLSPSPLPRSNESGKLNKGGTKDVKRSLGGRKLASSVPPARPSSALHKEDNRVGKRPSSNNKETNRRI